MLRLQVASRQRAVVDDEAGTTTPEYTLSRDAANVTTVTIILPGMSSAKDIELDIDATSLSLVAPGRYALDMTLPGRVDADAARARFKKARHSLILTLPPADRVP